MVLEEWRVPQTRRALWALAVAYLSLRRPPRLVMRLRITPLRIGLFFSVLGTCGGAAAPVIFSGQQEAVPKRSTNFGVASAERQQPSAVSVGVPTANPANIIAQTPTPVTITVPVVGSPTTVTVQRLSASNDTGATIMAYRPSPALSPPMNDEGRNGDRVARDHTYTTVVTFQEPSPGSIRLQVVATAVVPGTTTPSSTAQSQVFTINVAAAPTRQTSNPGNGQTTNNGGNGSSGSSGLGGFLGGLIGGLLSKQNTPTGPSGNPDSSGSQSTLTGSVQAQGLTLRYPARWQYNTNTGQKGPINLNTFNSQYLSGGIVPPGQADIDISYLPTPNGSVQQIMAMDLQDSQEQSSGPSNISVGGSAAIQATYTDVYSPQLAYRNMAVYVPRGAGLYKFFLSYRKGDAQESTYISEFNQILSSVKFTQ